MSSASDQEATELLDKLLGYLNFSSGATDVQFLSGLNELFDRVSKDEFAAGSVPPNNGDDPQAESPLWQRGLSVLKSRLDELGEDSAAFANAEQATAILDTVQSHLVPGFRVFHRDALMHRDDDGLCSSFMIGRMMEALLQQPKPWDSPARASDEAIAGLNTFLGHRPVPTLETQKIEPRRGEWTRPIPIFVTGAGVAVGPYQRLIENTLELLGSVDGDIARAACFEIDALEELAIDPRAYDFDHPVNRRPNYHFGEWDPQHIDNQGRYRRFVLREVTLQAMMARVHDSKLAELPQEELLWEAGAVLAGTILMASGISGSGPASHDSETTLMTLVTRIAAYRDAFYERRLEQLEGPHGDRLRAEVEKMRQPFGAARQHLNNCLARKRAEQIEHVRLAKVFARMGYVEAAQRQVDAVQVASARMTTRIDCAITAAHQAIRRGQHDKAIERLDRITDLLHRGIACGAIVDPWNILGFDGNFSLFPALENSVRDHRVDDLVDRMERIFDLFSRLWSAAAAFDEQEMASRVASRFDELAQWWHRFAAHEVSSLEATSALAEYAAAEKVAEALNNWHRGGAATGDVGFWAPYVENFDSPKAYALVIETLLNKSDFVSSMSLLMHWISQSPPISLETGQSSFHQIAHRWIRSVVRMGFGAQTEEQSLDDDEGESICADKAASLLRKFFDFLEANAESYWDPPSYERLVKGGAGGSNDDLQGTGDGLPDDSDGEDLFKAAYENVIFQDSTDDGNEGSIFDSGTATNAELEQEAERIVGRLAFLDGLARMWTTTSIAVGTVVARGPSDSESCDQAVMSGEAIEKVGVAFDGWYRQAAKNRHQLFELLREVGSESLPRPAGHHESMVDYDRQRLVKESLLEQIISTVVEMSQAERFLLAARAVANSDAADDVAVDANDTDDRERELTAELHRSAGVFAAALRRDRKLAGTRCDTLLGDLPDRKMLYVPLAKGGMPRTIAAVRIRHRVVQDMFIALPRLGMVSHTVRLLETVRMMEKNLPAGRGAVTQYDELFDVGFRELVKCLVRSTATPSEFAEAEEDPQADAHLIECLEQLTEIVLRSWLDHSRTLRLSVLERVRSPESWDRLTSFIQSYGGDLFTQGFMKKANIRAILHCGVDAWLSQLEESGIEPPFEMLRQLDESLPRQEAVENLTLTLESVIENYHAYLDYNSTTTQSDRGEKLYMLLDFLRLKSAYDRVAWNLKPVVISHEVLVRRSRNEAAQLWRRALTERVGGEADRYIKRLGELQGEYAMRMASVADRLGERFLRPMTIDRMRALVQPAIQQQNLDEPPHAFQILEDETKLLMREPAGSGLDVPQWLTALEEEIEGLKPWSPWDRDGVEDELWMVPVPIELEELHQQLEELSDEGEAMG